MILRGFDSLASSIIAENQLEAIPDPVTVYSEPIVRDAAVGIHSGRLLDLLRFGPTVFETCSCASWDAFTYAALIVA